MKYIISISRFIVGVLFIFSGLIKANDPLGLSYKMQEFFEVWGWHGLNDFTLAMSVLMIAFEIIAGVAVLVGWKMNLFSWLLLLLTVFFTFLTGYALFSGKVRECGCFGDCIPLSAQQSFIKDLILLALILLIFANRHKITNAISNRASIIILALTTIFSFALQWWVLTHLPIIDCLPYKKGKNILAQMKPPAGAIGDSTVITFVYNKGGKEIEFTAEEFPEDFDESIYQFVKRYDKLVRKGNANVPIKDFVLLTADGIDSTKAVLEYTGEQAMLFTKNFDEKQPAWTADFMKLLADFRARNIKVNIVTSSYDDVAAWAAANGIFDQVSIFKCDFVAIKTAARVNPTLYLVKNGTITGKWAAADFNQLVNK